MAKALRHMTTSIVIPAFNGLYYLKQNLPFVLKLGANEIVVVDDTSSDGTSEFIKSKYPSIKLIQHLKNAGFPVSVNDGFSTVSGDIIILLNQDVKPHKDLLKYTLPHFKNNEVFAVTFNEKNHSWADGGWKKGFLEFKNGELDNQIHESLWASGGSAAFRHDLWNKLGGFDPIFTPGYFEDLDLSLRARRADYKILWDPKCQVEHVTETAFNKAFSPRHLRYIKERNYLLINWRNLPPGMWPVHISTLIKRIISHPGYLIPTIWALCTKLVS